MDNYIFGYGSLICADSRARTGETGRAMAVTALDISRSWSVPVPASRTTAVGAIEHLGSRCNGVIFPVTPDSLEKFDIREVGYSRIHLTPDRFDKPAGIPNASKIWTYVGTEVRQPSDDMPIAQSYLDVIIKGCLSFGDDFVETFFNTTGHWHHLLNDRHAPRYLRPIATQHHYEQFDALIAQFAPESYLQRSGSAPKTE